jgi:hypothetical protein
VKFRGGLSRFADAGSTSSIRPNEDVRAIKAKFAREFWLPSGAKLAREFWLPSGKEFAKKIACDKLEEVGSSRFC